MDVMHYISTCTIRWPSQIARFRFFLAGGFEALLIGATDNFKYKNNSNLRESCLSCLKKYPASDLTRFRSHCFYRNEPDEKITQLYKLLLQERRQYDQEQNAKLELYLKAREDRDNKSLNLGTRLRAAKIRANVEVYGTIEKINLPEAKSKVLLPCIDDFDPTYELPSTSFQTINSKHDMFQAMKTSELQTARSNAARAAADALLYRIKRILNVRKRIQITLTIRKRIEGLQVALRKLPPKK